MRWLVTGGLGFIGSTFIRLALRERSSVEIVNLDAMTYAGNPANLADVEGDQRYRFLRGDICDPDAVRSAIGDGVDAIVNFAAETHVDRSILDPEAFLQTDILGTHVLLEAVRERAIARGTCRSRPTKSTATSPRRVHRERPVASAQPVLGEQSRRRSASARVSHDLRSSGDDHARQQYVRAVSVSGETHPALRHQLDRRSAGSGIRRRHAGSRLAARAGSRARYHARARARRAGQRLQSRRR